MKLLPRVLLFLAALLAATTALAQWTGPPPMQSIDLPAANSKEVVTGILLDFAKGGDPYGGFDLTIDVTETIKGDFHGRIRLHINRASEELLRWKRLGSPLLLAIPRDARQEPTILDLSDENLAVFTADLKLLRSSEEVLRVMKELVRKTPGTDKVDEYTRHVPASQINGKLPVQERSGSFSRIGQLEMIAVRVPVDERLEKYGQKLVNSKSGGERIQGIDIIRRFNTPNNVNRLKELLSDPAWTWTFNSETNKTIVYNINSVRLAAFDALKSMGISSTRPVTEDPVEPRARVVSVDLQNRVLTAADIEDLNQYPKLIDLSVASDKLDSGVLTSISRLKPLKMLYLQGTDINDEGLAHLAGLPNLAYLNLASTQITSGGLEVLSKFKALRRVDLGFGESDPGVKRLRQLRSDIEIQPDEFEFLSKLKPQRTELGFGGRTVHAKNGFSPEVWRYGLVFPAESADEVDALLRKELPKRGWKLGIPGPDSAISGYHRDRSTLPPPNPGMHRDVVYLPEAPVAGYEQIWGVKSPPDGRVVIIERIPAYRN